ncbi:MAG: gliding motility-associated C-terminal domain-containing protein [Flavobacteriales bacterium]
MKTWIYSLLLLCLTFSLSTRTFSQVDFFWEPFAIHNYPTLEDAQNDPELFALDGFVTWRLYVEVIDGDPDIADYVVAVLGDGDTNSDLDSLFINFDCCTYQHPSGNVFGTNINSFLLDLFPSLNYDSWVTIGGTNDQSNVSLTALEDIAEPWVQPFEDPNICGPLIFNTPVGGAWVTFTDAANDLDAFTDENNRVLLGQFTVPAGCQLIEGTSVCINYFPDGITGGVPTVEDCFGIPTLDPCFTDPIILELDTIIDNVCLGASEGEIQVIAVTNVTDLTFEIIPPIGVQTSPGVFTELPAGDYEVRIINNETLDAFGDNCFTSEFFTVDEPDSAVSAELSIITNVQCDGDSTGVVQIIVDQDSGTPFTVGQPYTVATDFAVFSEFTAPNIFEFDSLDATMDPIQFFIQDSNFCLLNLEVELGPDEILEFETDVVDVTCNGLDDGIISITILNGADVTATWEDPLTGNGLLQTDLAPGDYSVELDDGVTCPISVDFTITEPDTLTVSNVTSEIIPCFGDCTGTITYTASGGSGELSESIIQNLTLIENGSLCAGSAQLTISDTNNCSVTETLLIGQNPQLLFNGIVTDVSCNGADDGSFNVSASSGGSGEYTFTPVDNYDAVAGSYINLGAQQYTFTMTDELSCSHDTVVTISEPVPFITQSSFTNVLCNGANDGTITVSATGGSGVFTYTITDGDSNDTGEFTNLAPNTYEITGSDDSGCPFIIEEALVISEPDPLFIQALELTEPGCGGENTGLASVVPVGGTPDYFYNWNGGVVSAFPSQTGLSAGENTLLITDANGCQNDTTFTIDEPEEIIIVIAAENVTCTGMCDGTFQATATPVGLVDLNFGNIPNTGLCEGEYPVIATDESGCVKLDTIFIGVETISDIEYTIFTTPVSCFDEADGTATVAVTGGQGEISYEWSDALNQNTATAIGLIEDFYSVTISDELGCTFTEELFIEPTIGCFYVSNALTPNGDGANDEWILGGFEFFPENKIEVFNRWGQKVFESIGDYSPWDGKFNSNRLPVADYYYVITYDPSSPPLTGTVTIKY